MVPYFVKGKLSTFISASCPLRTKPMSLFCTIASISSSAIAGTICISGCAGVTTSTATRKTSRCRRFRSVALISSCSAALSRFLIWGHKNKITAGVS